MQLESFTLFMMKSKVIYLTVFVRSLYFFLDRGFELELSWVTRDNPKHGRVPVDVAKAAEDAAKAELADSDSEDDM